MYCILDENSTVYEGTNYLPEITYCNHYFYSQNPTDDGICGICHKRIADSPLPVKVDGYYEIHNADQLKWYLNTGIIGSGANARLMKDIVINDGTFDADGNYTKGRSGKQLVDGFVTEYMLDGATFDGNNHAIVGLYGVKSGDCGLFGRIAKNAKVKDLTLKNCYLKSTDGYAGGVTAVCANNSEISNCYVTDSHIEGDRSVGGIAGNVRKSTITHCGSNAVVSGKSWVGGICGYAADGSSISYSYATGTVSGNNNVGGICGYAEKGSSISYSYATGTVSGERWVGGICGYLKSKIIESVDGTIIGYIHSSATCCYFTGEVKGSSEVGGICGENENNPTFTLCYTTASRAGGNENDRCVEGGVSLERFKSGEIAWRLNGTMDNDTWKPGATDGSQTWRQTIGTDSTPQFEGETVLYDNARVLYYNKKKYDLDHDGKITIADLAVLIDAMLKGATNSEMELDDKEGVNIGDVNEMVKQTLSPALSR